MLKPMHDKILIKRIPANITPGGIALPHGDAAARTEYGQVLAVGAGRKKEDGSLLPMTLKAGDKVMYPKGTGFQIDGDQVMMHEADVWGLVE